MSKRYPQAPRLKISVTSELIESSKRRDSSHCMIAEAVKIAVPGASNVSVDLQTIRFSDMTKRLRFTYLTPRIAQVAIIQFDQGTEDIDPYSFRLRGGHVTNAGARASNTAPLSDKQVAQREKATASRSASLDRTILVDRHGDAGNVPDRIGGKPPPTTPFARRRAYGLRALER
jgi:hypothetical protein